MTQSSILSLLSLVLLLGCQKSSKEFYREFERHEIYFDSFNFNDGEFWVGNDGIQKAEIKKGEYYFESLEEGSRYNAPTFDLDPSYDFEIEVSITGPEDGPSEFYGIVIGQLKQDSSFIDFKINNSGRYLIGTENLVIAKNQFEASDFMTFKKLTVRKLGKEFSFFINEELKYTYPIDEFMNVRAGPLTYKRSSVWMDYIKVHRIKKIK